MRQCTNVYDTHGNMLLYDEHYFKREKDDLPNYCQCPAVSFLHLCVYTHSESTHTLSLSHPPPHPQTCNV